ncbi:unnamed protein product [Linum tenue]|uniref:Uncharacterized protein n=1 Tax=Linum tenue TaxID=586396 RepID=A0AAV0JNF2_9ROSI|nr:unnamed protein product [Linum tenue]
MAAATNANANSATSSFSLKLIIDKKEKRVLCAEAGKDFVDFLFNFLAMPVGAIAMLVTDDRKEDPTKQTTGSNNEIPGCVTELYDSTRNMNVSFFQNADRKAFLASWLHPETKFPKVPLLPFPPRRSSIRSLYKCAEAACNVHGDNYYAVRPGGCQCRYIDDFIDAQGWPFREADFVKDVVTYMVMDDLTVTPVESMMSGLSLLAKFNIKDVGVVEQRVVQVGTKEGVELLRAFMHTKSALTTVFLGKKETIVNKAYNWVKGYSLLDKLSFVIRCIRIALWLCFLGIGLIGTLFVCLGFIFWLSA